MVAAGAPAVWRSVRPKLGRLRDRLQEEVRRQARHTIVRARSIIPSRRVPDGAWLHLGSGRQYLDGWVNIDSNPDRRSDLCYDLSKGLPAGAGSVQFIYSEHLFEHLTLDDGRRLMADCRRVLRPGGVMRVAMPDLATVVECYRNDWRDQEWIKEPRYDHIDSPAHMLNYMLREWGHQYVYDAYELGLRLSEAGFVGIVEQPWGESSIPELRSLESRSDSKLIMEATVPGTQ